MLVLVCVAYVCFCIYIIKRPLVETKNRGHVGVYNYMLAKKEHIQMSKIL